MTFMVTSFLPWNTFGKLKSSSTLKDRLVKKEGSFSNALFRVCDNSNCTTSLKQKQDINPIYYFAVLRKMNFSTSIIS